MKRLATIAIAVYAVVSAASAQPAPRPAWEWTEAERIAERTNPKRIRERLAALDYEMGAFDVKHKHTKFGDSIDGARRPELLLPLEVFHVLITTSDAPTRDLIARSTRQPLPPNFWQHFDVIAAPVTALHRTHPDHVLIVLGTLPAAECRALHDALEAARREFGAAFFDRLLYETVAPRVELALPFPATPAQLTRLSTGCR